MGQNTVAPCLSKVSLYWKEAEKQWPTKEYQEVYRSHSTVNITLNPHTVHHACTCISWYGLHLIVTLPVFRFTFQKGSNWNIFDNFIKNRNHVICCSWSVALTYSIHEWQPINYSFVLRDLKLQELKPPVVNQQCQCLVYKFTCKCDLCDADYVDFIRRHQHLRVAEHCKGSSSCLGNYFRDEHLLAPKDLSKNFSVLKKCTSKFDCLVYEMFFINELRPSHSICAEVFKWFLHVFFCF